MGSKITKQKGDDVFGFLFNFSPTYPGLKLGFVPPFKACGQNDTTPEGLKAGFNTTWGPDLGLQAGYFDQFGLILTSI